MPPDPPTSSLDFESALGELESLVERLERGDLPLEEALKTFERGVELTRHCQGALKSAQQKVEILLKRGSQAGLGQTESAADPGSSGSPAEAIRPFRIPEDDFPSAEE